MIDSLAFSPDGRRILSGSWDGTAKIWDSSTGELLRTFLCGGQISCVAWSPDGTTVAIGCDPPQTRSSEAKLEWRQERFGLPFAEQHTMRPCPEAEESGPQREEPSSIRLFDSETGTLLRVIEEFSNGAAFSADGRRLAVASWNQVAVFDILDGRCLCQSLEESHDFRNVMFSNDGAQIGAVDSNGVWVFDAFTADLVAVAFNECLWSGSQLPENLNAAILRLPTESQAMDLMADYPNLGEVQKLQEAGQAILSSYARFQYVDRFWRELLPQFQPTATNDNGMSYQRIAFSPDGRLSAVTLETWRPIHHICHETAILDAENQEIHQVIQPSDRWTRTIAFAPDGNSIACASDNSGITLWDVPTGMELRRIGVPPCPLCHTSLAPHQPWLAAIDEAGILSLHAIDTRQVIGTVASVPDPNVLQFSPLGETLLIGAWSGRLELRDAPSLNLRLTLEPAEGRLVGGAFSADGKRFIGVCDTPSPYGLRHRGTHPRVVHWSVENGRILRESPPPEGLLINSLTMAPDNTKTAILTNQGAYAGQIGDDFCIPFEEIRRHSKQAAIAAIAFAGPNQLLLANDGYGMTLIDLRTKALLSQFIATSDGPKSFAFTSDGKLMARSTAYFNEIQLFELPCGRLIREFLGHQNHVNSLAIHQDKLLISGGADGTIKFWDLQSGELLTSLLRLPATELAEGWERLDA